MDILEFEDRIKDLEGQSKGCCNKSMTQSAFNSLIEAGSLSVGSNYYLTDLGLTVTAISKTEIRPDAGRVMLVPKTYLTETLSGISWKGVWHSTKTASINDHMIWGAQVWKNKTGNIGTATDDITLDSTNWELVPKVLGPAYTEKSFLCIYDYANNWISKQWDDRGNEFGISYEAYEAWKDFTNIYVDYYFKANPVDISDWNYPSSGTVFMSNNKVIGIWNNVEGLTIAGNEFFGFIANNNLSGSELRDNKLWKWNGAIARIYNNNCGGIISNTCSDIYNNSNSGIIFANVIVGDIHDNVSPCVHIRNNSGSCDQISVNSNAGNVWYNNLTGGAITDNTVTGNIGFNTCGNIHSNSCGKIERNKCSQIYGNSNTACKIYDNIVTDSIYNNANDGDIESNRLVGGIFGNTNRGIYQNVCGWIYNNNGGNANIFANVNNGWIYSNNMNDFDIHHNVNNGNITGATLVADITDPAVDK